MVLSYLRKQFALVRHDQDLHSTTQRISAIYGRLGGGEIPLAGVASELRRLMIAHSDAEQPHEAHFALPAQYIADAVNEILQELSDQELLALLKRHSDITPEAAVSVDPQSEGTKIANSLYIEWIKCKLLSRFERANHAEQIAQTLESNCLEQMVALMSLNDHNVLNEGDVDAAS